MELKGRKLEVNGEYKYQSLEDHIYGVERRVSEYAEGCDFKNTMKTIALLHDTGKAKEDWQKYLLEGKKRVSHSNLGMYLIDYLLNEINTEDMIEVLAADIIEYCIGSHHGLFDIINNTGLNTIEERIRKEGNKIGRNCAINNFYRIVPKDLIDDLIDKTIKEIRYMYSKLDRMDEEYTGFISYYVGVIIKVLLSMQIDADWSDAAAFEYDLESKYDYNKSFSWDLLINEFENYIKNNFNSDTDLNKIRTQISDECFENSKRPTGIYKLDVPTGGGKTVSAMRFALNHAKHHNKDRVVYISPYISILEQNADVYRRILKQNSKYILEHHSNIICEDDDENYVKKEAYKFFSSNWSSKIILTSMVQLLNSFFSGDKRAIRRLHRLKNSVIIIDEIQSMPFKIITPFNLFINAMSEFFNTSFVLCTATQPPYQKMLGAEEADKKTAPIKYANNKDLVKNYSKYNQFDRVDILDKTKKKPYSIEDITDLFREETEISKSVLMIANTRSVVDTIYTQLKDNIKTDHKIYMLSNNMCPAHRLDILKEIKNRLNCGLKTILISTALIEAGVDVSFHSVIRSLTGIDSIAQAAGRCNRSGEYDRGRVSLINIDPKLENISMMEEIKTAAEVTLPILNDFKKNPEKYDNNLLSTKTIEIYFKRYHDKLSVKTHYDVKKGVTLYDLLNQNEYTSIITGYIDTEIYYKRPMKQSFKTAGDKFKAIDDLSNGVIVPYKEGMEYINRLLSSTIDFDDFEKIISSSQLYTVGIYLNKLEQLKELKVLSYREDFNLYILNNSHYDMERGVVIESAAVETVIL